MRLLLDALNFAALRHREQRRKGEAGAPYVNHLIEVAHLLSEHGVTDPIWLAAAVLHDSIEDTEANEEQLRQRFGSQVAAIVAELTDPAELDLATRRRLQVDGARELSEAAQNIRVADKLSNLRGILVSPPENWPQERKLEYWEWAGDVVKGCARSIPGLRAAFDSLYDAGHLALTIRRGGGGGSR